MISPREDWCVTVSVWSQRTIFRSQFSPYIFGFGSKLRLSSLCGKHYYLLSHLIDTNFILKKNSFDISEFQCFTNIFYMYLFLKLPEEMKGFQQSFPE